VYRSVGTQCALAASAFEQIILLKDDEKWAPPKWARSSLYCWYRLFDAGIEARLHPTNTTYAIGRLSTTSRW
jgi:hypothetical protein